MANNQTQSSTAPEMVPYKSAAAGHQGISTSADGSLLIKPCTQAEIDFYESAKQHPAFQAHMPTYMGSLSLGDEKLQAQIQAQAQITPTDTQTPTPSTPSNAALLRSTTTPSTSSHHRSTSGHIISDPKIARSANKEWTPSGGAKLSSALSIVLSNATSGFQKPNVIDLKLGARLWDDDAPLAKRKKLDEVSNTSTSGSLGFRVAGMKVYIGEGDGDGDDGSSSGETLREVNTEVADGYKTYNKFYGRNSINESNITSAFVAFLSSLDLHPPRTGNTQNESDAAKKQKKKKQSLKRKLVIERLHQEVTSMEYVLENEESRMYSASILMVYEGDPTALEEVLVFKECDGEIMGVDPVESDSDTEDDEDESDDAGDAGEDKALKQRIHEAVMIDFAHAHWTPGRGADGNVLRGIKSIRKILEDLLDEAEVASQQL